MQHNLQLCPTHQNVDWTLWPLCPDEHSAVPGEKHPCHWWPVTFCPGWESVSAFHFSNTELALECIHCAYHMGQVSVFSLELVVQCIQFCRQICEKAQVQQPPIIWQLLMPLVPWRQKSLNRCTTLPWLNYRTSALRIRPPYAASSSSRNTLKMRCWRIKLVSFPTRVITWEKSNTFPAKACWWTTQW